MSKSVTSTTFSIAQALANFDISIDEIVTNAMTNDSRTVKAGDIFCAVIGSELDGRQYIDQAVASGASLVIAQCQHQQQHGKLLFKAIDKNSPKVLVVQFYQLEQHLFTLAQLYYQQPQQHMKVVGITGTNGKTSTAITLAKLLTACQQKAAVIGTIGAGVMPTLKTIANTTPGATETLALINDFATQGVDVLAMEVSSHALAQKRVLPELFDIAVFTNLSRDHLDFHNNMADYADTKFSLFAGKTGQIAILNGDDSYAQTWLSHEANIAGRALIVFGRDPQIAQLYKKGYVVADNLKHHLAGISFDLITHVGTAKINSPLLGDFNVDNLLAAIAVMLSLELSLTTISQVIAEVSPVPGRMESFSGQGKPLAIVDYAHTPDGLACALQAAKKHCQAELWVVFGCGGDRDKGKRREMGAIAEQYADHIILTNDNPRTEAPELIVSDILAGCKKAEKITIILNREQALKSVFAHAKAEDCIVFAGKGHEDYIIVGTEKQPYNERQRVQDFYQGAVL